MKSKFWWSVFCAVTIASLGCITIDGTGNNDDGEVSDNQSSSGNNNSELSDEEKVAECQQDCEGCCDDRGTCRPGNEPFHCGAGGELCSKCPSQEKCKGFADRVGGYCSSCTAFTCDGCCTSDDRCVSGTSDSECGSGGNVCTACSGEAVCDATGVGGGTCR